jgi:hypothetical protein
MAPMRDPKRVHAQQLAAVRGTGITRTSFVEKSFPR